MTKQKIREVARLHAADLAQREVAARRCRPDHVPTSRMERLAHLQFMAQEIENLLDSNRKEKAFRWLGFIQGCLWGMGEIPTIKELKNYNRPD